MRVGRAAHDARPPGVESAEVALRGRGFRLTVPRRTVLEVVRGIKTHPTAEEVHRLVIRRALRVSLDTVYRNLRLLVDAGLLGATVRATSPFRRQHPGPSSLHVSPLRAHRGRRGAGCPTALAGAVKTRRGPHQSHGHASPDRLLWSWPGVPGARARSAAQTSSGGGCQGSRRASFRAVRAGGMMTDGLAARNRPRSLPVAQRSARKERDRYV
jgi:Ferric uptake regulator family